MQSDLTFNPLRYLRRILPIVIQDLSHHTWHHMNRYFISIKIREMIFRDTSIFHCLLVAINNKRTLVEVVC